MDLIYGLPFGSWEHTWEEALALGVPHLSAYALTVEPKTAFRASAVREGVEAAEGARAKGGGERRGEGEGGEGAREKGGGAFSPCWSRFQQFLQVTCELNVNVEQSSKVNHPGALRKTAS